MNDKFYKELMARVMYKIIAKSKKGIKEKKLHKKFQKKLKKVEKMLDLNIKL